MEIGREAIFTPVGKNCFLALFELFWPSRISFHGN